ncbi:hypothetical protein ADU37_CDS06970 [Thermococcus sp. 2319x1]|uniref:hypothetical protein n=1 Tax=Thermococcus sp. 2319x1 TaxID=1674923 RepID=UPI00073A5FAC|nr:hypothetical protein [Thermococcus sp. 2319x1]ALV62396.1 hypothetical protein ADU37_CDS06970 [Thermococcus sp. 2319x1]
MVFDAHNLTFYNLSSAGIIKVYDVFPSSGGIYFTAELNKSPQGAVGLLVPSNGTFYLWKFPSNYSRLVPDGIFLDSEGFVYMAIMEGDSTD